MSEDQDSEKEYDPTQKKLDDARKKGEVAKSMDLVTASGYAGFALAAMFLGAQSMQSLGTVLVELVEKSSELSLEIFSGSPKPMFGRLLFSVLESITSWFVAPIVLVFLCILGQKAFVVAPSKIKMKGSRISIISGFKNKFGRNGLFEFFKSFSKLLIYCLLLGFYVVAQNDKLIGSIYLSSGEIAAEFGRFVLGLLMIVIIISATIGVVDMLWQLAEHTRKNKMSRKEIMDETKQSEGDPAMKQQRRQRGHEIAMNRMLVEVPKADVIIVNPTHYSIALMWDRTPGSIPRVVAKGVDEMAAKIREIAIESAIPLHSDPPTARAIYSTVEIGDNIEESHFPAVAAALRFAERIRSKSALEL